MEPKSKTGMFILIGVVLISCLLCMCGAVAFYILTRDTSDLGMVSSFKSQMGDYITQADEMDSKWDASTECDSTEKINALMDLEYEQGEIRPVEEQIMNLLDEEWACYKTIWDEETEMIAETQETLNDIDCDKLGDLSVDCSSFKSEINTQEQLITDIMPKIEVDYTNIKESYNCYADVFETYFESDDATRDAEYTKCDDTYTQNSDETMESDKDLLWDSFETAYELASGNN